MFLAVIMGYVVSAVFLFCGIANTVVYLQGLNPGMTASGFVNGLAMAMWPLALAAAIYILTQIAILMERQCIITENPPPAAQPPAPSKGKAARPAAPSRPATAPQAPFIPPSRSSASSGQQAMPVSTSLKEAAAAAAIAAADASAAAWENKGNHTAPPQGSDEKGQEDLHFFRID